jgi:hypothetical protein
VAREARFPLGPIATLISGLAIAGALVAQTLSGPASFAPAGPVGSLQTVTLMSGQVYFGRLQAVGHGGIVLSDVYEAVTTTDPKTEQRTTRLVSRRQANWHGPSDMAIPGERIMFTETIGADSAVAKTMESGVAAK